MLKFQLFKPKMIYQSIIHEDDTIETNVFPTLNNSKYTEIEDLNTYSQSSNLSLEAVRKCLSDLNVNFDMSANKKDLLSLFEKRENK